MSADPNPPMQELCRALAKQKGLRQMMEDLKSKTGDREIRMTSEVFDDYVKHTCPLSPLILPQGMKGVAQTKHVNFKKHMELIAGDPKGRIRPK